MCEYDMAIEMG